MDSQRQQPYIPGHPSAINQTAVPGHVNIPPPPPRVTHTASHAPFPPPPPGPPPGSGYNGQSSWQQGAWARQPGFSQGYVPPPPPPPSANQLYHQHLAYSAQHSQNPGSLSIPSAQHDQPLTSATYIPGGSSFGPGVGIPPLIPHDSYDNFSRAERPTYPYEQEAARYVPQSYAGRDGRAHQLPAQFSSGLDLSNYQCRKQPSQVSTRENSGRHASSAVYNGISTHEANENWPLDRVLLWLASNGFSTEWQEAFKSLDIKGADFIDLGHGGANRMGNLGKLHQDVYPQLNKECEKLGVPWDQAREREEGVRMRKLIRNIGETKHPDSGRLSDNTHLSASTDGGVETSPHMRADAFPFDHPFPDPGHSEPASRSEVSRNILVNAFGERRRHSPSTSSDQGVSPGFRPSRSRGGSPAAQFASTAEPSSTYAEFNNKRNSSDSMIARGFRQDQHMKHSEMVSKDSKGFLSAIRKKIGPSHHSPDEPAADSPTSPVRYAQAIPYSARSGPSSSDTSLGYSAQPGSDFYSRPVMPAVPSKRFIFVTLDGWNYRLVDVTEFDAADLLRARLCNGVGIKDPSSALIYVTEPGKVDHEEPLSDTMLVVNRRSYSDEKGSLKLYIQSLAPRNTGLGLSFGDRMANGAKPQRITTDDVPHLRRVSPALARRPSNSNPPPYSVEDDHSFEDGVEDMDPNLLARLEEHRRATARKQQEYLRNKREQLQGKQGTTVNEYGIKRGAVIDFDVPRSSPYEDKRTDSLIPQREPPTAPSASSTLTKVNSLNKKPGEKTKDSPTQAAFRRSSKDMFDTQERPSFSPKLGSPSMGVAGAIAGMGRMSGSIAKPLSASSPLGHSPRTPSGSDVPKPLFAESADSTSAISRRSSPLSATFKIPSNGDEIAPRKPVSSGASASTEKNEPAPFSSTAKDEELTRSQSRLSHGPDFEFRETEVSFLKSPQPTSTSTDSDEDSDEGLFAIPLANNKNKPQAKKKSSPPNDIVRRLAKPALTVNTTSRAAKGLSVSFKSPAPMTPRTDQSDPRSGHHSGDQDTDDTSPTDMRNARRRSIVRDDIWASRPTVEGMIDHLDDFFPDIDLDEPYLEGTPLTPPMSPTTVPTQPEVGPDFTQTLRDRVGQGWGQSDTLGSDESTLKAKTKSVAQRNVSRSGGLGRMKSIREVAKGAHQIRRNQSIAASKNSQTGMLRRKSTKMFGARIMQISPKPGSRLSELDPLPQHPVPQAQEKATTPQRQATFRIITGQLIGKGTYGRVYLGMNAETGEILAVKQVEVNQKAANYDKDRIKEMVAAMDQEIDTMQHLEHPNIVQYLGCHRSELSISIYLEYVAGGSIGSCLRKHGKFEESVVKSLTIQTLRGLEYLHDKGILHRDLKADNILLDLDGTCKISDFGISKKQANIYGNDASNSMQGSVFWMAPEVVQSQGKGYSAKVDVWSLGCVVLEMFAGRRPWSKEEAIGAIFKLGSLNQIPPIPDDVSMNISPAALAFMYDCFTINTFDRPTAGTLVNQHPFCTPDPNYDFLDTELHAKIGNVQM